VVDTGRQSVGSMTRVLCGKLDLLMSGLPDSVEIKGSPTKP